MNLFINVIAAAIPIVVFGCSCTELLGRFLTSKWRLACFYLAMILLVLKEIVQILYPLS